jgi:hypothetical protein
MRRPRSSCDAIASTSVAATHAAAVETASTHATAVETAGAHTPAAATESSAAATAPTRKRIIWRETDGDENERCQSSKKASKHGVPP